ncbi:MAG: STAS domain-containing protein [Pseudomonadota bacterium]
MAADQPVVDEVLLTTVNLQSFDRERRRLEAAITSAGRNPAPQLHLSFRQVDQTSTLMVALLLALTRTAKRSSVTLEFVDVPAAVRAIIDFTGVDELLSCEVT